MYPEHTDTRAAAELRNDDLKIPMAIGALLLAAVLFMPRASAAANLVINGDFDTQIFSWDLMINIDTAGWSSQDASGSSSSGSARLTRTIEHTAGNGTALRQCVAVEAGRTYDFASKTFLPSGQPVGLQAGSQIVWFASDDCTSGFIDRTAFVPIVDVGTWVDFEDNDIVAPPGTLAAQIQLSVFGPVGSAYRAHFDDIVLEADDGPIACVSTSTGLCLNQNRFQVVLDWRTLEGDNGLAQGVKLASDSGYFWFFDNDNVEVVVKVLDGCGINGRYWVFAAGLTNVEAELTVTDTELGTSVSYVNTLGSVFEPIQDIEAFASCP